MRRLIPEKPWIIGGHFNMITTLEEKSGGLKRIDLDMEMFRDMISEQRMVYIQTINHTHTWNNRRGWTNQIASRLDRFLISKQNHDERCVHKNHDPTSSRLRPLANKVGDRAQAEPKKKTV